MIAKTLLTGWLQGKGHAQRQFMTSSLKRTKRRNAAIIGIHDDIPA